MDAEAAQKRLEAMLDLVGTNIATHPDAGLMTEAYHIAIERDLTPYNSIHLALANKLGGSLLSRDSKQIEAAKKLGIEVLGT